MFAVWWRWLPLSMLAAYNAPPDCNTAPHRIFISLRFVSLYSCKQEVVVLSASVRGSLRCTTVQASGNRQRGTSRLLQMHEVYRALDRVSIFNGFITPYPMTRCAPLSSCSVSPPSVQTIWESNGVHRTLQSSSLPLKTGCLLLCLILKLR
jgi:hypothetical protein